MKEDQIINVLNKIHETLGYTAYFLGIAIADLEKGGSMKKPVKKGKKKVKK